MGFNSVMDDIGNRMDDLKIELLEEEITEKSGKIQCEKCREKAYSVEGFSREEDIYTGHLKCKNCGFEYDMKKYIR